MTREEQERRREEALNKAYLLSKYTDDRFARAVYREIRLLTVDYATKVDSLLAQLEDQQELLLSDH